MPTLLPPLNLQMDIVGPDGRQLSAPFGQWLSEAVYTRLGGANEMSNTELATDLALTQWQETISGTGDDKTDNAAVMNSKVGPQGSLVKGGFVRARVAKGGTYRLNGLVDVHRSISLRMDSRGGILFRAGDQLPGTTKDGAEASLFRMVSVSPPSNSILAWHFRIDGFNIDGRRAAQINQVHGIRVPNNDPRKNSLDSDPNFTGNKDYVAGSFSNGDLSNCSGSGVVIEATNGRAHFHSYRCLSNSLHGMDLQGNDVVIDGHSAAGGNTGFGIKTGAASGYLISTANLWGASPIRSLTCGAFWANGSKNLSMMGCQFNDWARFDGNAGFWRSPVMSNFQWAPFNELFSADGVMIDTTPGGDLRLQAAFAVTEYKNMVVGPAMYSRTTKTNFATPNNIGGQLDGSAGTAVQYLWDVSDGALINIDLPVSSAPDVKPWVNTDATLPSYQDPVPIRTRTHGNATYYMRDCFTGLHRLGARGQDVTAHAMLACDETAFPDTTYVIEAGTKTTRNMLYGRTEHQAAVQYTADAFDSRDEPASVAFARPVAAYDVMQRLFIAPAGVPSGSITLPTDMTSSYTLDVLITGGPITTLTWAVSGAGSLVVNADQLPVSTVGFVFVRLWYESARNTWYPLMVRRMADPFYPLPTTTGAIPSDCTLSTNFSVVLTGNATLANPANPTDGATYTYVVIQDATGGRTFGLSGGKLLTPGGLPAFSTAANAINMVSFKYVAAIDKFLYIASGAAYA